METYDVIIVGAGPAGISTALHLQRFAPHLVPRTLVLEKARHPRWKPCAGGVLPDGADVLRNLGLEITEVPHTRAVYAYFEFDGRGVAVRPKNEPLAFYVILREEFDAWLAEKARERGLAILEETPVRQVVLGEDGVEVVTSDKVYRARVVVGADGAHSVVRRAIAGGKRSSYARAILIRTPAGQGASHGAEEAFFEFGCVPRNVPGYVWDFPIPSDGRPMRCWGIYDSGTLAYRTKGDLRGLLAEELEQHGRRLEDYELRGGIVHHFSTRNLFSAPGVLLVGDAAGVDSLYGEGISPALGYGRIAAEAIVEAFASGDFTFQAYRTRILRSELGRVLARRAVLARLIYRLQLPSLQRLLWWRMGRVVEWVVQNFLVDWAKREWAGQAD